MSSSPSSSERAISLEKWDILDTIDTKYASLIKASDVIFDAKLSHEQTILNMRLQNDPSKQGQKAANAEFTRIASFINTEKRREEKRLNGLKDREWKVIEEKYKKLAFEAKYKYGQHAEMERERESESESEMGGRQKEEDLPAYTLKDKRGL